MIDNCPAHPHIDNLKAIKLYFLPPNTTSKTQPMDEGVIGSLKAKYRKNVVRKIIQCVEKKKTLPKISLLQGMQMLFLVWGALSTQTIVNCIRKSGISTDTTFADVDTKVIAVQPPPSDAEIVSELLETKGVSDDDDDDDDYSGEAANEPVKCPDTNELLQVIKTLQRFSLFLDKRDTIQSYASRIESQVDQHFAKKKKQASISDFLNKK